jgi:hypothetical protein
MQTWSKEKVFEFLTEEPRIGRLASVTEEGDPHVVPVWFRTDGDQILVHTMGSMKKARNLRRHGRFALTVDTDTWPYQGVTLRGSATVAGSEELAHQDFIEHLSVAYLGEDTGRPLGRYIAGMEGEHVILVLQPDTWHTFDYS